MDDCNTELELPKLFRYPAMFGKDNGIFAATRHTIILGNSVEVRVNAINVMSVFALV